MNGKQYNAARKRGYRSGLEVKLSEYLTELKQPYLYEKIKIEWEDLTYRTYTPDFVLTNGIIIESKGLFTSDDRRKHLEVQKQHPTLDIRFVFYNSKVKLSKTSKTTYGMWCDKHNIKYFDKIVPLPWLEEKGKRKYPPVITFPLKKFNRS